ncbi:Lysine 2,3-aminomutase [Dissulfuribacter thermophilus]|uniref:Lysine 2,3-aminomutase n=1 Tax=Dissulfuribacter thermophilus TaxID=1156395 RepID=A0A1B9F3G1_9BACT|nr:KamA family radical SAM protein [Dissulfuribacter thermophilus]OCC14466.1 Lysine 2,3-aminomutase [Dissulfuribacter thermophilus]
MYKAQYITKIEAVDGLSADEKVALKRVTDVFPFRANEYYLSLIDWSDPNDPIRKIVIPQESELKVWGKIDASNESNYTVVPGCEHKYADTAILLSNHVCGCFCRFCFRKRLFIKGAKEVPADLSMGLEYIRKHKEINNVLITGGDGLLLSTGKLEKIIKALCEMDHVRIIRIGSKILAFNPFRVLNDPDLPKMLGKYSGPKRQIYVMTHFNHPKEITPRSVEAIEILKKHGIVLANQTPLLKGINDDPDTLGKLFNELSFHGVPPYYVFINRPVIGNREFSLSLKEAYEIFEEARNRCSGLGKRARLAMSHETGKVELLAVKDDDLILRYQRFVKTSDKGRIFSIKASNDVYWLDEQLNPLHFEDAL